MPVSTRRILYEDDYLLAVDKRSGELVVKGSGHSQKLPLLDFLKKDYPGLKTLDRLDYETSGVLVFARKKDVFDHVISSGFSSWQKRYRTIVMGRIGRKHGAIRFPLPSRSEGTVEAETLYRVIERFANSTYVEATIVTGRHHHIRRHFQMIEHPLVLDAVYGHKKFNAVFRQEFSLRKFFLHASSVTFKHPVTADTVTIEAELPRAFVTILERLRAVS